MVDRVSETQRIPWSEVYGMNVFEFFNTLCYAKDKMEDERRRREQYIKSH